MNTSLEIKEKLENSIIFREKNQFSLALNYLDEIKGLNYYNSIVVHNIGLTYYSYGNFSLKKNNYPLAINCYKNAITNFDKDINNNILSDIYIKLAHCFQNLKDYENMKKSHENLSDLKYKPIISLGLLMYSKLCCADFHGRSGLLNSIEGNLKKGMSSITPFTSILVSDDPNFQLLAAKNYFKAYAKKKISHQHYLNNNYINKKIKIAYLSSDFYNHATSHLIVDMFEKQNNDKFEYYCFSYGKTDNSSVSQRIKKSFNNFYFVNDKSDEEIASMIYDLKIDIAVDLKGHTKENRLNILSFRPSPIQISYLGFPGTLGTNFIDYLIMDNYIVNSSNRNFFSEKIIHMPSSYQCNSNYSETITNYDREYFKIPKDKFILCSLNNSQKYNKKLLNVWAKILKKNNNTVLWLLDDNSLVKKNILLLFESNNIKLDRIIFSPRVNTIDHLSRMALADLFLDSFPCNAHTTASDALLVDLPIVTLSGKSMSSRVTGSLLSVLKLKELIAKDYIEYEEKINYYINNKQRLNYIRKKINKTKYLNLFNSNIFIDDIEKVYEKIWNNYINGKKIAHLHIKKGE